MNNLDKTMAVAQGALDHHGVKAVLVDQNQECYLPKDLMLATANWTKSIFTFDGKALRRIEPEEGRKLAVTAEGKQLIGVGQVIGRRKAESRVEALINEAIADGKAAPVLPSTDVVFDETQPVAETVAPATETEPVAEALPPATETPEPPKKGKGN